MRVLDRSLIILRNRSSLLLRGEFSGDSRIAIFFKFYVRPFAPGHVSPIPPSPPSSLPFSPRPIFSQWNRGPSPRPPSPTKLLPWPASPQPFSPGLASPMPPSPSSSLPFSRRPAFSQRHRR